MPRLRCALQHLPLFRAITHTNDFNSCAFASLALILQVRLPLLFTQPESPLTPIHRCPQLWFDLSASSIKQRHPLRTAIVSLPPAPLEYDADDILWQLLIFPYLVYIIVIVEALVVRIYVPAIHCAIAHS